MSNINFPFRSSFFAEVEAMIAGVFDRSGHNLCAFFEKGVSFRRSVGHEYLFRLC